jgi:fucose permease
MTNNVLANPLTRSVIYIAFALTGAVTNLLGPIAPEMESAWQISDAQVGQLFSWQFATSTLATILVGRHLRTSAPFGLALIAIGVYILGHASGQSAAIGVAVYGAGLGLAIPSLNLLVGTGTRRERASSELALLNAVWVGGAAGFPFIHAAFPGVRGTPMLDVIALVAVAASVSTALVFAKQRELISAAQMGAFRSESLLFALFFFLYVGAEVGISGWLPTHANRATGSNIGSQAVVVFWLALLLGRLLTALLVRQRDERKILLGSLILGLIATSVLFLADSKIVVLFAAALTGAGFAPLFPVNLALFARAGHHAGWVLACAGQRTRAPSISRCWCRSFHSRCYSRSL